MTKGLARSLARGAAVKAPIVKQSVPVRDVTISVTDGAPGFGTVVIGDLPEGNILFLGAVAYLRFTTESADITATFDGDYSIGTAPTADNSLGDAGEANLIPSTALGAATAKVSPVVRGVSTDALGGGILDNTDGAMELNLNLLIDDAAISDDADFTVEGLVDLAYIVLGDD